MCDNISKNCSQKFAFENTFFLKKKNYYHFGNKILFKNSILKNGFLDLFSIKVLHFFAQWNFIDLFFMFSIVYQICFKKLLYFQNKFAFGLKFMKWVFWNGLKFIKKVWISLRIMIMFGFT